MSRRSLLRGALALGGATFLVGNATVSASASSPTPASSVLVVLSLRGGADGLSLVVPYGDPGYYSARPNIAIPQAQLARGHDRRHVRAAPPARAAAPALERQQAGRDPRDGAGHRQPLALLRDGGGRGGRPRVERPDRVAEPAGRHQPGRRGRLAAAGCRCRERHAAHRAVRPGPVDDRRLTGRREHRGRRPDRPAAPAAAARCRRCGPDDPSPMGDGVRSTLQATQDITPAVARPPTTAASYGGSDLGRRCPRRLGSSAATSASR